MTDPSDIADDAPFPMIAIGGDNRINWANQAAQAWLGLSLRRLTGKSLDAFITNAEPINKAVGRCRANLSRVSLYDFVLNFSERADETGLVSLFPSGADIGLIFQMKNGKPSPAPTGSRAVSAMGRMLAHEIKNPLAGIDGAAQLLAMDIHTDEGGALITLIRSEINRIRRLADRMEKLGDRDPENVGPVNIHELLSQAKLVIQSASPDGISFTENYDPSLPVVIGDPGTLMQAVLNLIKNAAESIEQSGEPGSIGLETAFRSGVLRRGEDGDTPKQLPIEIRVTDTGPGVSDDMRARMFQPFVTNKPVGQGLGLALVSKVATAHGGLVELQSRPGHTTFSLLLPSNDKEKS